MGNTGRGALEYKPDWSIKDEQEKVDFDQLATEAEKILASEDYTGDELDAFYKYAGNPSV